MNQTYTVGRGSAADIQIPKIHDAVGKIHLSIEDTGRGLVTITDMKSTNGTFVRVGQQWEEITGARSIPADAEIMLGDYQTTPHRLLSEAQTVALPPTKFAVAQTKGLLEDKYELKNKLPKRAGYQSYFAIEKSHHVVGPMSIGESVALTVVANVEGIGRGSPEIEAMVQQLSEAGDLSSQPSRPATLLPMQKVIWAADRLAYVEEYFPHVLLSDVLVARGQIKRPIPFSEAVTILTPLAEGLDFMLKHGARSVLLASEEIWISCDEILADETDETILSEPLSRWPNLRICFSTVCLASGGVDFGDMGSWAPQSGVVTMSDSELHPVPSFARLVYRILNGTEVAAATQFTPDAYVPAVTLGPAANNLLRDLLCQQKAWTTVSSVLKDLCSDEGVASHRHKPSSSPRRRPSAEEERPDTHEGETTPGPSASAQRRGSRRN